jgi:DNA-directed RNA polymerase specialized sigma24 family protein
MLNCRSIPPAVWEEVRQALVFFYSRRCGISNAEDLAHDTLVAILTRDDYEFGKVGDFQKVCYGFAHHVYQAANRQFLRQPCSLEGNPLVQNEAEFKGLRGAELRTLLDEMLRLGKAELSAQAWDAMAATMDAEPGPSERGAANRFRVTVHRARKKLNGILNRRG